MHDCNAIEVRRFSDCITIAHRSSYLKLFYQTSKNTLKVKNFSVFLSYTHVKSTGLTTVLSETTFCAQNPVLTISMPAIPFTT